MEELVSFVGVNERPLRAVFVHNAESKKGGLGGGNGEEEEGDSRLRGPVWLDVEEFRSDGESKGPVRERPGPFEV